MGIEQFANNPKGTVITLASGYTAGGLSIVVSSTSVFPTLPPYRIIVDPNTANAEIMYVTGVAGTTLTVTTGYEGTTNVNHSIGAIVAHVDTAGLQQKITDLTSSPVNGIDPAYGCVYDCRRLTDITATSGSNAITSGGLAAFTSADTGKIINLFDYNNNNYVFRGTFTYVSSTSGTLSGTAGNSLVPANCIGYIGTDNSTAIQAALNQAATNLQPTSQGPNLALGGGFGRVEFYSNSVGNMMAHSKQIVVPTNVIVDGDVMVVSMVGTATTNTQGNANRTFPWVLMPGASIDFLQMFCNYTMGINLGTTTQQSHSFIHDLTQWDIGSNNAAGNIMISASVSTAGTGYVVGDTITLTGGTATTQAVITVQSIGASGSITAAYVSNSGLYSVIPSNPVSQGSTSGSGTSAKFNLNNAPNSHIALSISGNDTYIDSWWAKAGNIGILLAGASDVRCNSAFPIGQSTGISMQGCEQIFFGTIQCDTIAFEAIVIDACHDVRIASANCFSINSISTTCGLAIGQNSSTPNNNLNINFSANRSGGDAVRMGAVTDSCFNINVSNGSLYGGGGVNITNAINFTGAAAPTGNILINLTLGTIGTAITAKTGTGYGMFLLNGNPFYSVQAPTSGNTITIDSATPVLLLNPAGTLSTLTVNMPANPMDGMIARIGSDQGVTVLTVGGNGNTIKNAPTTLAAGGGLAWQYNKSGTTWFRIQ